MTASFFCIGDLHLDRLKGLFPDNHLDLQFFEINKAMHTALKNGYKNIIYMGDISENTRLSQQAEVALISHFFRWDSRANIHVILGNHDYAESGNHSLLPFIELQRNKAFKTVKFYAKKTVKNIEGLNVNFSPYPFTDSEKDMINFGHFEVSGSTRDNGQVIKKAHDVDKKAVWGMGHLHTPHDVGNVHYCGTLYQLNFGERLPKGSMLIQGKLSGGSLQHRIKRISNDPTFKLINLVIESLSDTKKIEKNPLYRYRLLTKSNIELPENIMEKFPNIVKTEGFSNKEELKAIIEDSFIEINNQTLELPSLNEHLEDFLIKVKGANKKQVKRALEIVKEVRGSNDS